MIEQDPKTCPQRTKGDNDFRQISAGSCGLAGKQPLWQRRPGRWPRSAINEGVRDGQNSPCRPGGIACLPPGIPVRPGSARVTVERWCRQKSNGLCPDRGAVPHAPQKQRDPAKAAARFCEKYCRERRWRSCLQRCAPRREWRPVSANSASAGSAGSPVPSVGSPPIQRASSNRCSKSSIHRLRRPVVPRNGGS